MDVYHTRERLGKIKAFVNLFMDLVGEDKLKSSRSTHLLHCTRIAKTSINKRVAMTI